MTDPTSLSPAAQAVLDAFGNTSNGEYIEGVWIVNEQAMLAAALRASAKALPSLDIPFAIVEEWERIEGVCASFSAAAEWGYQQALAQSLAIAAELEGAGAE